MTPRADAAGTDLEDTAADLEQRASDLERTASDLTEAATELDQSAASLEREAAEQDQIASSTDHSGSELDQIGSDTDQLASNRDQAVADRELAEHPPTDPSRLKAHAVSRAERELGTVERGRTAALRVRTATERLDHAARRDESARMRDLAARARDRAADARDRAAAELEAGLAPNDPSRPAHAQARSIRAHAAADRARAAADRERAAFDREQATHDLRQAEAEIQHAQIDELTGAYVRGIGMMLLQKEIDRARHSDERLVLAFVDVDELKRVNDSFGHEAGDVLLRDVVRAIRSKLRSYDPVVRVGGDEFVCALSGIDLEMGVRRFAEISELLQAERDSSISVGFAALQRGDSLENLTARGDAALYEAKRERRAAFGEDPLIDPA